MHKDRPGRQHEKPLRAKKKRKKDTYKFCLGIVGRFHTVEYREHLMWGGKIMCWDLVCVNCGKVLETVWTRGIDKPKTVGDIELEKLERLYEYTKKIGRA